MLGEDISKALGGISDEMVEQAACTYEKKNTARTVLFRVAAVAAAVAIFVTAMLWPRKTEDGIVTAPGVLKVYAYDVTTGTTIMEMDTHDLTENIVESNSLWFEGMSSLYGLPLKFCIEDPALEDVEVTFRISVNLGECIGDVYSDKYKSDLEEFTATLNEAKLGTDFEIENGETIFWRLVGPEMAQWEPTNENGGVYIDALVYAEDHVVGYVVVQIIRTENLFYAAIRKNGEYFPKVNGEYQDVTEEYVRQRIAEAKQN